MVLQRSEYDSYFQVSVQNRSENKRNGFLEDLNIIPYSWVISQINMKIKKWFLERFEPNSLFLGEKETRK